MNKYNNLFKCLPFKNMVLRNRIIASPMGGKAEDYFGLSLWEKSLGGSAMVHLTDTADLYEKYTLEKTKEAINVAKQDGAKVSLEVSFLQIKADKEGNIYAPSEGIRYDGQYAIAFDEKEMERVKDQMIYFSINAKKIGFDAITLEYGHDSFLSQFLSDYWNRRTDEYGGSLDNKCRYPLEVLKAVREAVGRDYPIILRISRQLMLEESYTEDEMFYFLKLAEPYIDMVNVSSGMDCYGGVVEKYESNVHAITTIFEPHNYNKEFAKRLKENTSLLIGLEGGVMSPEDADQLIKDGYADCIFFGRALVADPFWPRKIMDGKENEIVPCIRCQQCYHVATKHWNVQCSVNPLYKRRNREMERPFESGKKKVAVVGGGPAGMTAALAANRKGHEVILIEKDNKLGGLLNPASEGIFKADLRRYLKYLINRVERTDINVMLNTEADKSLIESLKPDRLILALGSKARELKVEGSEKMMEITEAIYCNDPGQRVVIVGGGSAGMEFALEQAIIGKDVTVVEMLDSYAANSNELYKVALRQHIKKQNNLHILLNTRLVSVKDNTVVVNKGESEYEIPCDTVINASGRIPLSREAAKLYGVVDDTMVVGDCERIGSVVDAVNLAYYVGYNA